MSRIFQDFMFGDLSADIEAGTTTLYSAGFAAMSVVSGGDYIPISLDPYKVSTSSPEIVWVTAHTAGATSVTVTRGQEGTTARSFTAGTHWIHAVNALDAENTITGVVEIGGGTSLIDGVDTDRKLRLRKLVTPSGSGVQMSVSGTDDVELDLDTAVVTDIAADAVDIYPLTKVVTTNYTLKPDDHRNYVEVNSDNTVLIRLPNSNEQPFPVNFETTVYRAGVGEVLFVAASGVVVRGDLAVPGQDEETKVRLRKANNFVLRPSVSGYTPTDPNVPPPATGLVADWVGADIADDGAGNVTSWADATAGYSLVPAGTTPTIGATPTGEQCVVFDGTGRLRKTTDSPLMPAGADARTIITVVKYTGVGKGGFSYGTASSNESFGLVVSPSGNLEVSAWGTTNDRVSTEPGTSEGWMIQAVRYDGTTVRHYRDELLIDTFTRSYNTATSTIVAGAEIDEAPDVEMCLAAVYVYDGDISDSDFADIHTNLRTTYLSTGTNPVLTAVTLADSVGGGSATAAVAHTATLSAPPEDGDLLVAWVLSSGTALEVEGPDFDWIPVELGLEYTDDEGNTDNLPSDTATGESLTFWYNIVTEGTEAEHTWTTPTAETTEIDLMRFTGDFSTLPLVSSDDPAVTATSATSQALQTGDTLTAPQSLMFAATASDTVLNTVGGSTPTVEQQTPVVSGTSGSIDCVFPSAITQGNRVVVVAYSKTDTNNLAVTGYTDDLSPYNSGNPDAAVGVFSKEAGVSESQTVTVTCAAGFDTTAMAFEISPSTYNADASDTIPTDSFGRSAALGPGIDGSDGPYFAVGVAGLSNPGGGDWTATNGFTTRDISTLGVIATKTAAADENVSTTLSYAAGNTKRISGALAVYTATGGGAGEASGSFDNGFSLLQLGTDSLQTGYKLVESSDVVATTSTWTQTAANTISALVGIAAIGRATSPPAPDPDPDPDSTVIVTADFTGATPETGIVVEGSGSNLRQYWSGVGFGSLRNNTLNGMDAVAEIADGYTRHKHRDGLKGPGLIYQARFNNTWNNGTRARVVWDLTLESGFSFGTTSYGGKLGGLGIGSVVTGGRVEDLETGGSVRLNWSDSDGQAKIYVYHKDQPGQYGEPTDLGVDLPVGTQFEADLYVDTEIGRVILAIDNVQVFDSGVGAYRWDSLPITAFLMNFYHGGGTDAYGPIGDCWSRFHGCTVTSYASTPPAPTPGGISYPTNPVLDSTFSDGTDYTGASDSTLAAMYTAGVWDVSYGLTNNTARRDPGTAAPSDTNDPQTYDLANIAKVTWPSGTVWYAGRLDGSDKSYMNQNPTGNGFDNGAKQENQIIITGEQVRTLFADPEVFPTSEAGSPADLGPHTHSFGLMPTSYWNTAANVRDITIAEGQANLRGANTRSTPGSNVSGYINMYWPELDTGVFNNGRSHSGYIGRPRKVAGVRSRNLASGQTIYPFPQGLRMIATLADFFVANGENTWTFTICFPCCWNGEELWNAPDNPEGSLLPDHMAYLRSDGTPPPSHPYVLPQIHWFVRSNAPASGPRPNTSGEYLGPQNRAGITVPAHGEVGWYADPVISEWLAWAARNEVGLARIGQLPSA